MSFWDLPEDIRALVAEFAPTEASLVVPEWVPEYYNKYGYWTSCMGACANCGLLDDYWGWSSDYQKGWEVWTTKNYDRPGFWHSDWCCSEYCQQEQEKYWREVESRLAEE